MKACFFLPGVLFLAQPLAAQTKPDLLFQQSPPLPCPEWVKIIDHGAGDPRLKGMLAPEGVKIEIVAEEPAVINPVGMTFDDEGNLYVLEWRPAPEGTKEDHAEFTYKDGSKRKAWIMKKPIRDWVKLFRWNADKKAFDPPKVLLEDELPSSILVHEDWIYLTGQGTVRRYKLSEARAALADAERDPAKRRRPAPEVIAQGFCGFHHHQVSGLSIGNDGWLYVTSGDDDNVVEGSDGSKAVALRTGAIFRMRPDGSKVQLYSIGYRNPYRDVSFDAAFNMFHADNDNEDGSKWTGCRLMHIPEGADFGWRLRVGARCCVPDHVRSAVYGEAPGKLPPLLKTGRGAPAGLLIYNDTFFPENYRGLLFYPDVFRRLVRAYRVVPKDATFEVKEEFDFMKSADGLFRPCQMVLGPDGAMYVCDWRTDSGGAGRLWGDTKHGRIYRITWAGTKAEPAIATRPLESWVEIRKRSDAELFKALESENFSDRLRAQRELVKRGAKQRPALLKLLNDEGKPTPARIAALGAVQSLWNDEVKAAMIQRVRGAGLDLKRLAADALALHAAKDEEAHEALAAELEEPDPAVRRAIYIAMGRINAGGAADALVNALRFDDGRDAYRRDGLVRAIEYTGKAGIDKLLALADSGEGRDLERVLEVYPALRSRAAGEGLARLLKNYHVTPPQLVGLIRSYSNYQLEPPLALTTLEAYLASLPKVDKDAPPESKEAKRAVEMMPVKLAALEALASGGALHSDKMRAALVEMLGDADPALRLRVIHAIEDILLTRAAPVLIDMLPKASDAAERLALVKALGTLKEGGSYAPLEKLFAAKEADDKLRLETFRALAAIEPRGVLALAEKQLTAGGDIDLLRAAVFACRAEAGSANRAGKLFLEDKLPRPLLSEVTEGLRRHAAENGESARLLGLVLKGSLLLSLKSKEEIARLSEEVRTRGDAWRGRSLYLNNRALACINCHKLEGIGGNIGPDLTRVWETHSLEKVMEAILDPSKEIKEGYQTYQVTTAAGLVHQGLKIAHDAREIVLRTATGQTVRVPLKEVDTLIAAKTSLMPDDAVKHLKYEEFLDLVAFVRSRVAQEEMRRMVEYQVIGPFPADTKKAFGPELKLDPDASYDAEPGAAAAGKLSWQARLTDAAGALTLRSPAKAASYYVLASLVSPKEQKVKLRIDSEAPARVIVDGKKMLDFGGASEAELRVPAGATPVLVRVVVTGGAATLALSVAGDGVRLVGRVEK